MWFTCRFLSACFVLLCWGYGRGGLAQELPSWKFEIGPQTSERSPIYDLLAGQGFRVAPNSDSDLNLDVFVYEAGSKELAGKSDDESAEVFYEWRAPAEGRYYIVVRNTGEESGSVDVRVLPGDISKSPGEMLPPNAGIVNVFYATDRIVTGRDGKGATYGTEPAENDQIEYGIAKVSVARAVHQMGELEGPSIIKLEFRENPQKHVMMLSATPEQSGVFFKRVSERAGQSSRHEALVFVHGFNVTFEDGVRRAAQLSYDLGFEGATILFSWPSHGEPGLVEYNKDGRNAELSAPHLRAFLCDLALQTGVRTIHVIAHSMGTRVAVKALAEMPGSSSGRPIHIREVALMAPDIDAAEFRRLAVAMKSSADRITLYASSHDAALKTSEKLAGYPRAGEGGDHIVVIPGVIETIDSSAVDTSLLGLGHAYYADNSTILSDLFRLIRGDAAGDRFRLRPVSSAQGPFWVFAPAAR